MDSAADFVAATQVEADLLVGHAGINGAVTGPVEYRPLEEIDVDDLGAFAFTFLGHYHKCQKLKERVWYIGSPLQQNRGERDDTDKGFLLYDSERNKFKRIPLHMPEFKTYKGNTEGLTGHYVDVFTSSDDVTKTLADVEAIKPAAVNLVPVPVVESKWKVRVRINPAMSLQDMAKKYIKEYLPDRMERRREDVLRMALSFLEG
jgi:DNA repair exonuclease SbcCD nuclease subunit